MQSLRERLQLNCRRLGHDDADFSIGNCAARRDHAKFFGEERSNGNQQQTAIALATALPSFHRGLHSTAFVIVNNNVSAPLTLSFLQWSVVE